MINELTVTLLVPADRLTDLQAFCLETGAAPAPAPAPAAEAPAPEPKPKATRRRKSADTKEARATEAKAEAKAEAKVSLDEVREHLSQAVRAKKQVAALELLKKHGADTLPQLAEEKFAAFVADLKELING